MQVRHLFRRIGLLALAVTLTASQAHAARDARKDGRITQIIREVTLLLAGMPPRNAALNDDVREGTAVRTGGQSRAELTFKDQTITRLGANTLFNFTNGGRRDEVTTGSTLLRVPKSSGGATILSSGVIAGVTGTTVIFEYTRAGGTRLTVLEGSARMSLAAHREITRGLRAGQTLLVPPGATTLGEPTEADIESIMKTSPLIVGFRPLPSRGLIDRVIRQQRERGEFQRGGPNGNNNGRPPNMGGPPQAGPPPGPGRR